jgi:hypothetical protein
MFENRRVLLAVLLYALCCVFLVMYFPKNMINKEGEFVAFSLNSDNGTILPFWLVLIILAFVSYCISLFV